jgi:hypothetical protein
MQGNWSSVVGALGIIGGLVFTAAYFREDSKNRHISNLLAIEERYRSLWSEAQQRKDLKRIFSQEVVVTAKTITAEEDVFVRRVILHFETGWRLERIMNRGEIELLSQDASELFSLPLPRAVWEKTKKFRNRQFVRFVDRALKNEASLPPQRQRHFAVASTNLISSADKP